MACKLCEDNLFKEKLGRCRSCMWLNLSVLIISAATWFICAQSGPKNVQTIALLLTFIASALLMFLHLAAYIYYRCHGIKHPTQDKAPPK